MARTNLTRLALAGAIITIALPVAAYASGPDPVPAHPVTRSDTLTKLEKPKSERRVPTSNKKLKPSKTTPSTPSTQLRHKYLPDQPWETEFFVENDVSGRQAMQVAMASFRPER